MGSTVGYDRVGSMGIMAMLVHATGASRLLSPAKLCIPIRSAAAR